MFVFGSVKKKKICNRT